MGTSDSIYKDYVDNQFDQIGRFFNFGQLFKAFGNN